MVTPGTNPKEKLSPFLPSLSRSLTGRVPADLRSQTSQIVIAPRDFPSDGVAHPSDTRGTPSPDWPVTALGSPPHALSPPTFQSTLLTACICHVLSSACIARSVNADTLLLTFHDWSLSLDPNTLQQCAKAIHNARART